MNETAAQVADDDAADDVAEPDGDEAAGGDLDCPECGKTFASKLALGAHRAQAHGVRGSSQRSKRRQRNAAGDGERRPVGRPRKTAAADAEPARQARRRKAVRETLTEIVSFTDEARGRGDDTGGGDLADVIRRDADKIANSIAWLAERFNPMGRLIDLAFGHGGIVTVGRGFLGVGTWTLSHWRQLIRERETAAAEAAGVFPDAEQIADDLQRRYG